MTRSNMGGLGCILDGSSQVIPSQKEVRARIQGRDLQAGTRSRGHGVMLLIGLFLTDFSVSFLIQIRTTIRGVTLYTTSPIFLHWSLIQTGGSTFSIEVPLAQMTLACVRLTKPSQHRDQITLPNNSPTCRHFCGLTSFLTASKVAKSPWNHGLGLAALEST